VKEQRNKRDINIQALRNFFGLVATKSFVWTNALQPYHIFGGYKRPCSTKRFYSHFKIFIRWCISHWQRQNIWR